MDNDFLFIPVETLHKYRSKRIAIKGYDSDPEADYYVGDFLWSENISYILGQVDSSESDFTSEGIDFLNEPFWKKSLLELIKNGGKINVTESEWTNDIEIILKSFKEMHALYEHGEIIEAPFPILFSETPTEEQKVHINKIYGDSLKEDMDNSIQRQENQRKIQSLDELFERYGFTSLRNHGYRKVFENYWLHIVLNRKDFTYDFKPFISMAPIIKDGEPELPYHDRHEKTKMYKFHGEFKTTTASNLIEEISLARLKDAFETLLKDISTMVSENDLISYLDQKFTLIEQNEREDY